MVTIYDLLLASILGVCGSGASVAYPFPFIGTFSWRVTFCERLEICGSATVIYLLNLKLRESGETVHVMDQNEMSSFFQNHLCMYKKLCK